MSKTILIVEDNDLNLKLFTDLLQSKGYGTLQATDGQAAVDTARKRRPDLVLMDLQLPGMSGLEATRVIKADAELRDVPVIAVTAFARTGDEARARAAGCDGYLAKPVSVRTILGLVNQFIGPANGA